MCPAKESAGHKQNKDRRAQENQYYLGLKPCFPIGVFTLPGYFLYCFRQDFSVESKLLPVGSLH